ncbi:MAG: CBS domain-containing protein [Phycisphaerales bacterium]|nr:CBS domain-containing protein [Phycisphaerales bacterium]
MSFATVRTQVAKDVMTSEPVCAEIGMSVRQVARLLEENEISGAPVIDGRGCVVGVVSKSDLVRRYLGAESDYDPQFLVEFFRGDAESDGGGAEPFLGVEEFMTSDPITAAPNTPLPQLAGRMAEARVHRVIVVDGEGFPVGIVTSLDLVKAIAG